MHLLNTRTQEEFEAEVLKIDDKDFKKIKKSKQFQFDWNQEKDNHVFKIVNADEIEKHEILGLISLTNIPDELRIHINLIESSNEIKGKNKKVDRIAACLLAFAVQVSFENGYSGFTSLIPNTKEIVLYVKKHGFTQYGRKMAIDGKVAIDLIQKYL